MKAFKFFWQLGWSGMEKVKRAIHNVPQDLLTVDTWVYAEVGDLCITDNGCLDEVKKIVHVQAREPFKGYEKVYYKHSKTVGRDYYLVTVKKGKVFKRWGKTFHHKPVTLSDD